MAQSSWNEKADYPKNPYVIGEDTAVLVSHRAFNKRVLVRPDLPCNIILVHGVNDVGTGYDAVEHGLCEGLGARLGRAFLPAAYRMPQAADKHRLEDDPDAVFFIRNLGKQTDNPVIPFYWGYREIDGKARVINGQHVDRHGNRLDKDLSKGGGPFINATSTLPDMWNRGAGAPADPNGDALRPLRNGPGRLYMVLAAQRLAALIAMIRDYEPNDTVSLVAHSQGCLLTLLAQAFLMQHGLRPADTLILTHPPYSMVDDVPLVLADMMEAFHGDTDAAMRQKKQRQYDWIAERQTFAARLQTLVNIVQGVVGARHEEPVLTTLGDASRHYGKVGARWQAGHDRDNRGKVYLYFCPEDMTVALDNVQGIGWQGVPDVMRGRAVQSTAHGTHKSPHAATGERGMLHTVTRHPLTELGTGFFQRVFTLKRRAASADGAAQAVCVGQPPPHDFVLRLAGEDDHAHIDAADRQWRAHHPVATPGSALPREGIRTITGEALARPVPPDLRSGQIEVADIPRQSMQARVPRDKQGPCESVDPIDAAIATASSAGLRRWNEILPDSHPGMTPGMSSSVLTADGMEHLPQTDLERMTVEYNRQRGIAPDKVLDQRRVVAATRSLSGKMMATIEESPNEARLRWQQEVSPKSFHSAIFASRHNHAQVTAYDVAIGSGRAATHPAFYRYLCAVADWRMKTPRKLETIRPSVRKWAKFTEEFACYWTKEPAWRKELIEGNMKYYTDGTLPDCLPVLPEGLPPTVVSETMTGLCINSINQKKSSL